MSTPNNQLFRLKPRTHPNSPITMRSISLPFPAAPQNKSLIQILSGTKHSSMAREDNAFYSVIDAGEIEKVLEFVGHDICEGIVVLGAVERAGENWCWSW